MIDQSKLELKVKARKAAEAAIQLLEESVDGDVSHFWRIIRDFSLIKAPLRPHEVLVVPMTDVEAGRFEIEPMPYGEYKGQYVGSVPMKRLDYYVSWENDFQKNLKRYMANEKVKARVREELDD